MQNDSHKNGEPIGNLLTYADASSLLAIPRGTLFTWVSQGTIPHVRLGSRTVRFRRDQLERWLEERTTTATVPTGKAARRV